MFIMGVIRTDMCCEVHQAMTELSRSDHTTSEPHVDLGVSRKSRDFIVLVKII